MLLKMDGDDAGGAWVDSRLAEQSVDADADSVLHLFRAARIPEQEGVSPVI